MVRALTPREKEIQRIEDRLSLLSQSIEYFAGEMYELSSQLEDLTKPGFYIPKGGFMTKKSKGKPRTTTKSKHNRESKPKDTKQSKEVEKKKISKK